MNAARLLAHLSVALFVWSEAGAQSPAAPVTRVSSGDGFEFTIPNIMRGPELIESSIARPPVLQEK